MITLNSIIATATNQQFAAIVKERLCKPFCVNQAIQPIADVTYRVADQRTDGVTTFVTLEATGTISYVPKGCTACATRTESFIETTTLVFINSAGGTPTIALTQGLSDGAPADANCNTAKSYQIATNVVVVATY